MKKNFLTSVLMTLVATILLGILYPLVVTLLAERMFPRQANGELIRKDGRIIGSRLIGQPFRAARYFQSRPSMAGPAGYDASNSTGSNLAPTNQALLSRVHADLDRLEAENPSQPVPIDLVTTSGSGLDPDISPAAAEFQVPRVAKERGLSEDAVRELVKKHTEGRQWGFLGEPRVNVLELNLDLDTVAPLR
jgi:potassium-transporting ATPase KdpC subunit